MRRSVQNLGAESTSGAAAADDDNMVAHVVTLQASAEQMGEKPRSTSECTTVERSIVLKSQACQTQNSESRASQTDISMLIPDDSSRLTYFKKMWINMEEEKQKALQENLERLQKEFAEDKGLALKRAKSFVQEQIAQVRRQEQNYYIQEMKKLSTQHKKEISEIKKKQWCFTCQTSALFHCCLTVHYCSVRCQKEHWFRGHQQECLRYTANHRDPIWLAQATAQDTASP